MTRPNRYAFTEWRIPQPPKPIENENDPRAIYRKEKARRAATPRPEMQSAKVDFDKHLERQAQVGRSGRPRSVKPKSLDLVEYLAPYTGGET